MAVMSQKSSVPKIPQNVPKALTSDTCNLTRKRPIPYDTEAYKVRNLVERCFNKLKHFRRVATRYDRRAIGFLSFLQLACAMLWMC
jgi:transposase